MQNPSQRRHFCQHRIVKSETDHKGDGSTLYWMRKAVTSTRTKRKQKIEQKMRRRVRNRSPNELPSLLETYSERSGIRQGTAEWLGASIFRKKERQAALFSGIPWSHCTMKTDAWSNMTQCSLTDTRCFGGTCSTTSHPQKTITFTVTSSASHTSLTTWRLRNNKFCILSFGWFPGVWISCADVSEHYLFHLLYSFFWVIPRLLNFMYRRFGTLFHLLYSFFWVIPRLLNFMCRRFGTRGSIFIDGVSCLHHIWRWNRVYKNVGT